MPTKKILLLSAVLLILGGLAVVVQGPGRRQRERAATAVFPGFEPGAVRTITIEQPEGTLRLARDDGGEWQVGDAHYPADGEMVGRVLEDLGQLKREAIASTNPEKRSLFGVDEDKGLNVLLEDGGGGAVAEFVVGGEGPDLFSGYLLLRGETNVLLVSSNLGTVFSRPLSGWRDRKISDLEAKAVRAVAISSGGDSLSLERDGTGTWTMNGQPVDQQAVSDYLGRLAGLRAAAFASEEELQQAGFDEPSAEIVVKADGGDLTITVGALKAEPAQRYLRTDRAGTVFLVSQYVADSLVRKEADFPPPSGGAEEGGATQSPSSD